jgi:hypothetical protein
LLADDALERSVFSAEDKVTFDTEGTGVWPASINGALRDVRFVAGRAI